MIDEEIQKYSRLQDRAESLKDRLPEDDELIRVIRFKLLKGFGVVPYLFDEWSLMALSHRRMTIEPDIGDGRWSYSEIRSIRFGERVNTVTIEFGHDRLWIGYLAASEVGTIRDWANGHLR